MEKQDEGIKESKMRVRDKNRGEEWITEKAMVNFYQSSRDTIFHSKPVVLLGRISFLARRHLRPER